MFNFAMEENRLANNLKILEFYSEERHMVELFERHYMPEAVEFIQESMERNACVNIEKFKEETFQCFQSLWHDNLSPLHIVQFNKSRWSKHFLKLLISNDMRNDIGTKLDLACVLLRVAWNLTHREIQEFTHSDMLEILCEAVVETNQFSKKTSIRRQRNAMPFSTCSKWYYLKGVTTLSSLRDPDSIEFCLGVKTCTKVFKMALQTRDEFCKSIYEPANIYLTVLYLIQGQKDKAVEYCNKLLSITTSTHSPAVNYVKSIDCSALLFIDHVAVGYGFSLLCHRVLNRNSKKKSSSKLRCSTDFVIQLISSLLQISRRKRPDTVLSTIETSPGLKSRYPFEMIVNDNLKPHFQK